MDLYGTCAGISITNGVSPPGGLLGNSFPPQPIVSAPKEQADGTCASPSLPYHNKVPLHHYRGMAYRLSRRILVCIIFTLTNLTPPHSQMSLLFTNMGGGGVTFVNVTVVMSSSMVLHNSSPQTRFIHRSYFLKFLQTLSWRF